MLQTVSHAPYGRDDLYSADPTERFPRDPLAGDTVYIKVMTQPVELGQTVWVTWSKNGVAQPSVGGSWEYQSGNQNFWQVSIGPFARGDLIEYTVHANENETNEKVIGPFSFGVASWSNVTDVVGFSDNGSSLDIRVGDSAREFSPVLRLAFPTVDAFHVQFSPSGVGLGISDPAPYTVTDHPEFLLVKTSALVLKVSKFPFRISVYESDGKTLIAQQHDPTTFRNLAWASDGKTVVSRIEDHYQVLDSERFHGFGERYDAFDQRGRDVNTYIFNEYADQAQTGRTYLAVPFFTSTAGYGLYVASTAYSVFNVGTARGDMVGFTVNTDGALGSVLEYYFFTGSPKVILDRYTQVTGRPRLPPKWAFGLWMSANEWHTQPQVKATLDAADQNQIPMTALVLEQWSDEATIYVWHGAEYTPKPGGEALKYADFTFPAGAAWQDPRAMVTDAHARGVRVVLWQISALREVFTTNPTTAPQQHLNDIKFALDKKYVVMSGGGKPYHVPKHSWYGNSLVPDFTNPAAIAWWMSKRAYLIDEVGIDGFKNDYGEMVFGRDAKFFDGSTGLRMHNGYALAYIKAYNDYLQSKLGDNGTIFSRAGTAGSQTASIFWAGDQLSAFSSFQTALRAGLSAAQSGFAFWSWDLAGFAGSFPSAELYLRSAAAAAFAPVMQLHSHFAPDGASETRTPWHVQEVTGDQRVLPFFRKFAQVRMNLLPYLYSEAKQSSLTGTPMMRPMYLEFPDDPGVATLDQQYMLGGALLVAPVTTEGATAVSLYAPAGEWFDFWYSEPFSGPSGKEYGAPLDFIPVYAREGAIIPLNLASDYELGSVVGNSLAAYANLTFRIYPSGHSLYRYYDDSAGQVVNVEVFESWSSHQVSVVVPKLSGRVTLQVVSTQPSAVTAGGDALPACASLAELNAAEAGWLWQPASRSTLAKLKVGSAPCTVSFEGVDKVAYQAMFAQSQGTTVAQNHGNFTGLGFVDGFDQPGASVTFSVSAQSTGKYWLRFRYANALGTAATRTVYVDEQPIGTLTLPPLADWDTWADADIAADLSLGRHQVRLSFDPSDESAINLNSLGLVHVAVNHAAVVTQHNDVRRTGANLQEAILTTANVNPEQFGKLFSYPVLGQVYAQPLYVSNLHIPGKGRHNVVFIATMNNRVYAFDADDPGQASTPLWQRHLAPSIPLPDANIGPTYVDANGKHTGQAVGPDNVPIYRDILNEVGILSTPVISTAQGLLFVVTTSKDSSKQGADAYSHHLRALDLATGKDGLGGAVKISARFKGDGYTSEDGDVDTVVDGFVQFVSHRQLQRAGLLLNDDTLYIAFASYGDQDPYHGWVLAYSATTLQQTAVFNTTPSKLKRDDPDNVGKGGIWQAGQGPAADEDNNVYVMTSNGGYRDHTDFADCFVKLNGKDLSVVDWFAPFNQTQLASLDLDVGSAGALVIPGTDFLLGGGKESKFFLLKRSDMGRYAPERGNAQIVQHFYIHAPENPEDPLRSARKNDGTGHHVHGGAIYWHGPRGVWLYIWAEEDVVKAFELKDGAFKTQPLTLKGIPDAKLGVPASQGSSVGLAELSGIPPGMPGGMLSLSANGNTAGSGILWATHPLANANRGTVAGVVRAFDASDLSRELWNSAANPARDDIGTFAKFCPPTVVNGKVYVGTFSNQVVVYGLLGS